MHDVIHMQAQIYYPMSDLSAIPRFFDALAVELRERMAAEGVTGGIKALKLLSHLLFASPEAESTPQFQRSLSLHPPSLLIASLSS